MTSAPPAETPDTGTLQLWLVRHGHTSWSREGRYAGWTDLPLSEEGEAQARALAAELPDGDDVSVWSSDLQRCVRTAELAGLAPRLDTRLRELDFGDIEGATWDELSPPTQSALAEFDEFAAPNGESVAQLHERVHRFLDELTPGRHIIVTHGGVVRMLLREQGADGLVTPARVVRLDRAPAAGEP